MCRRGSPAAREAFGFATRHEELHSSEHVKVTYDDRTDQYLCTVVWNGVQWLRSEIPVLDTFANAKFHANKLAETYVQGLSTIAPYKKEKFGK